MEYHGPVVERLLTCSAHTHSTDTRAKLRPCNSNFAQPSCLDFVGEERQIIGPHLLP